MIIAGFMLIVACIFGWSQINRQQDFLETQQTQSTSAVLRVSPAEAKERFNHGDAVFVDVRSPESFAEAHIPGAVNIPMNEFEARWKELDSGQSIILYCT
jgi:3-mercaptopyruvate sulfurtransferase SseA